MKNLFIIYLFLASTVIYGQRQSTIRVDGITYVPKTQAQRLAMVGMKQGTMIYQSDGASTGLWSFNGVTWDSPISGFTIANEQLNLKVDKVTGRQLSTNDYTTPEQLKLAGIASGATVNSPDANLRDRVTHTGLQAISTVTNLQTNLDLKANGLNAVLTGSVGIGTSAPISTLHSTGTITVGGGANPSAVGTMQLVTNGTTPFANRLTYGTDGTGWKFSIGKNQAGVVTDQFVINTDGNVGVGTTTPAFKLDVTGTLNATGYINTNTSLLLSSGTFALWDGNYNRIYNRAGQPAFSIGSAETYYDNNFHIFRNSAGAQMFRLDGPNGIFQTSATKHLFGAQADTGVPNQFAGDIESKGVLTFTKNSQTLPISQLGGAIFSNKSGGNGEVNFLNTYDASTLSTAFVFSNKTGASTASDLMTIMRSGNVGIGTTTPLFNLHTVGTIRSDKLIVGSINDNGAKLQITGSATISNEIIANSYRLPLSTTPFIYDAGISNFYGNMRVLRNISENVNDGMYIGYGNSGSAPTRIFDGGGTNALTLSAGTLTTTGLTKLFFGTQTDLGNFAQFAGTVGFKANVYLEGAISQNNNFFHNWKDLSGAERRMLGLSSTNFYMGDVDNTMLNSQNVYTANSAHLFYTNGKENARLTQGSFKFTNTLGGLGEFAKISAYNTVGTAGEASSIGFLRDNMADGNYGAVAINTFGAERMRIGSNGNVGIGTTNPTSALHVIGAFTGITSNSSVANYGMILENTSTGASRLDLKTNGGNSWFLSNVDGNMFSIGRSGVANHLNIFSGGNISIGTTTDSGYKLDVQGTARFTNNITLGNDISIGNNTNTGILFGGGNVFIGGSSGVKIGGNLVNSNATNCLYVRTSDSYVGIGTANPFSKLQVAGFGQTEGITIGGSPIVANDISTSIFLTNTGSGILNIQTSKSTVGGGVTAIQPDGGSLAVGTRAPTSKLHVVGIQAFADNASAIAGGLTAGAFYRTATGVLMVVF